MDREILKIIEQIIHAEMISVEKKLEERLQQVELQIQVVAKKVELMDDMRTVEFCIKNNETLGDAVQHHIETKFKYILDRNEAVTKEVMLQSNLRQKAMDRIGVLEAEMERLRKDVRLAFAKRFGQGVDDIGDSTLSQGLGDLRDLGG
jgi:hypothetical protein